MRNFFMLISLLPAVLRLVAALRKHMDPNSPGGRWIDPADRPAVNQVWWDAYDAATKRPPGGGRLT